MRGESRNLQETFLSLKKKTVDKLTLSQKRFIVEVIGTFIVVVLATGVVVIDAKFNGILGISFIAFLPFIGVGSRSVRIWQDIYGSL